MLLLSHLFRVLSGSAICTVALTEPGTRLTNGGNLNVCWSSFLPCSRVLNPSGCYGDLSRSKLASNRSDFALRALTAAKLLLQFYVQAI